MTMLPDDWSNLILSDYLKRSATYGVVKAGTFVSSGVPMLRGGDIKAGNINSELPHITPKKDAEYARTRLEANDVVVALVGYPGESALVPKRLAGANISRAVGLLRLSGKLRPNYLVHFLNSAIGRAEFLRPSAGSAQLVVNLKDLNKLEVPCPATEKEQEAIAEALSDADALIEGLERLIAKKRLIKQGAMQELLTGRRRLPGFSGEWIDYTIQDIANVDPETLGVGTPTGRIINYISLEDVNRGVLNGWSETPFRDAPSRARRILRQHDVLLGTVRPNLQSHLLFEQKGDNWIGSTGFAVLRTRPEICSPRYLFELIMSHVVGRQIDELIAGSNYPAISNRKVRTLQITLPSLDEQNAISAILNDMDAEIQALETRLEKARAIKEGMMQNLLTGRIRLV